MKREDLQGIRGFAILAVLAFHFFPNLFPNGYIGVDTFFVLSGFLMTMIFGSKPLTKESIFLFYFRRAKRILPLYLMVILVGCLSIFLLFPNTFIPMNMDSAWNSIFLYHNMAEHSDANVYFKMLNQADDIFTHTWSLCVEMQFYLLAPGIFFFFSQCDSGNLLTIFHGILILTSLGNHLLSSEQTAFNSVFCRVWQFLIGSGAFYLSIHLLELDTKTPESRERLLEEEKLSEDIDDDFEIRRRQNLSRPPLYFLLWISLGILAFFSFSPWAIPAGILRVTSTFLSALVILTGTLCEVNPMKNRILVYIGDISYSLYLVHWPIYVYVKHYYEDEIRAYLLAILASVILAIIITETFEKWYLTLSRSEVVSMILTLYLAIILIVLNKNGLGKLAENWRYGDEEHLEIHRDTGFGNISLDQAIALDKKWARDEYSMLIIPNCYPNKTEHGLCEFDRKNLTGNFTMFIVGNSMSPNLGAQVYEAFKKHAGRMLKYSQSYCEVLTLQKVGLCQKTREQYLEEVSKVVPDVLFLIDRPYKLLSPLQPGPIENDDIVKEALARLRKFENNVKKKIYILEAFMPPVKMSLSKFARSLEKGAEPSEEMFTTDFTYLNGVRRQEELIKRCPKCELMRISDVFIHGNRTEIFDEQTKLGYFFDGLHFTPIAQNLLRPVFQNVSRFFK